MGAVESVCWVMMSAPCPISTLAASASLPGSNQELTHTVLTLKLGLTDWAPSMKALMPRTTSGMGKDADVAGHPALGHPGGDLADDVAAFIKARGVGRDVLGALVPRGVLELDLGEPLGHLDGGVHEAEGCGEDQSRAFPGQTRDGALGVRDPR